MDEAYALPSEQAVRTALRTQQVIACESGVTNTVDPLGGSFFVEKLTDELEEEAVEILAEIERRGGMVKAVTEGWVRRQIEDAACRLGREVEEGKRLIVGLNCFQVEEVELPLELLEIDPAHEHHQKRMLSEVRKRRDPKKVEKALRELGQAVRGTDNLMPFYMEAARAYATIGEMSQACQGVSCG